MDQAENCANARAAGKSEDPRIRRIRFDPIREGTQALRSVRSVRWSRSTGPFDWPVRLARSTGPFAQRQRCRLVNGEHER